MDIQLESPEPVDTDFDIARLLDLVTMEHAADVADLLLGFLVTLPDPTSVREPATV